MNYLIIRNPVFRFFPARLRRWLGEEYLYVDVRPGFSSDIEYARVFPSYAWAETLLLDAAGNVRPHARGCVIRSTFRKCNVPGFEK